MRRQPLSLLLVLASLACAASDDREGAQGAAPSALEEADVVASWQGQARSPRDYVLEKFLNFDWVFLGEYHRVRHDQELVLALIPALHGETDVRHLALEFLHKDQTDAANALVTAPEYDRGLTIDFFRHQFPDWGYEEYLDIFRVVWESNHRLASERGAFRLIGLHPGIDWEQIHHGPPEAAARERLKQERYDEIMAEVLEEHVLSPGHRALVFTGIAHATAKFTEYWFGTDQPLPRMGNLVYREPYRSRMFTIALHAPFYDAGTERDVYPFDGVLDRAMATFGRDIGFDVVGTPLARLAHKNRSPLAITAYSFGELYDGYVMHTTPLKEYQGVTCIEDWVETEEEFRHYCRSLPNAGAGEEIARMTLEQFRADFCAPRPEHGEQFRRRFRRLPDL